MMTQFFRNLRYLHTTDLERTLSQMATNQAAFDADQKLEDAQIASLITSTGSLVSAFQALQANPAVTDLTNEDADAKAQITAMATAAASIQNVLTPAPAAATGGTPSGS